MYRQILLSSQYKWVNQILLANRPRGMKKLLSHLSMRDLDSSALPPFPPPPLPRELLSPSYPSPPPPPPLISSAPLPALCPCGSPCPCGSLCLSDFPGGFVTAPLNQWRAETNHMMTDVTRSEHRMRNESQKLFKRKEVLSVIIFYFFEELNEYE